MSVLHPSVPLVKHLHTGAESPVKGAPEHAVRRLVVRLAPLRLYRIRDTPEEAFSRRQRDIRVRLPPELPKRADAEPQVLRRESGEAIAHECHTLERDLDQRKVALLLQVTDRRRTSARRTGLRRSKI